MVGVGVSSSAEGVECCKLSSPPNLCSIPGEIVDSRGVWGGETPRKSDNFICKTAYFNADYILI